MSNRLKLKRKPKPKLDILTETEIDTIIQKLKEGVVEGTFVMVMTNGKDTKDVPLYKSNNGMVYKHEDTETILATLNKKQYYTAGYRFDKQEMSNVIEITL